MLEVTPRRTENISTALVYSLKTYIKSHLSENPDRFSDDFVHLDALRQRCAQQEPTEYLISSLLEYRFQLEQLSLRFPIDERNVRICFTWTDSLPTPSTSASTSTDEPPAATSSYNLGFEQASILFNLGAVLCQLAALQPRTSVEGLKRACSYYQNASGCFTVLSDTVDPSVSMLSPDFNKGTLDALSSLMLAQAQECFWLKAISDGMKHATVARLARGVGELYEKACIASGMSGLLPAAWIAEMFLKARQFFAAAAFRRGVEAGEECRYGEQLAWLAQGTEHVKKAMESREFKNVTEEVGAEVKKLFELFGETYAAAKKDNDEIYMELVPKPDTLPEILSAIIVKSVTESSAWSSSSLSNIEPLFKGLLPPSIAGSIHQHRIKIQALVDEYLTRSDHVASMLQQNLVSMNLPHAIEGLENPDTIPPFLLKQAEGFGSTRPAKVLDEKWILMGRTSEGVKSLLKEAQGFIEVEEAEEGKFKLINPRAAAILPSFEDVSKTLKDVGRNYGIKLESAMQSDSQITEKKNQIWSDLSVLSSKETLTRALPKAPTSPKTQSLVQILKKQLITADGLLKKIHMLKATAGNVVKQENLESKALRFVADKGKANLSSFLGEQFKEAEAGLGELKMSIDELDDLKGQIREIFSGLAESLKANDKLNERNAVVARLTTSTMLYKEILQNVEEGTKFYLQFEGILRKYHQRCHDFAAQRRRERDDAGLVSSVEGLGLS